MIRENPQINKEQPSNKVSFTCEGRNTDEEVAITYESLSLIVSEDIPPDKNQIYL